MNKFILILSIFFLVSCTETVDRLKRVGKSPELAQVDLPSHEDHEDVANTARLEQHRSHMRKTNSLCPRHAGRRGRRHGCYNVQENKRSGT